MLYGMRSFATPTIKECLFFLGLWRPAKQSHADAARRFAETNGKFWTPAQAENQHFILIEGHLSEYGPNYLFRTGLAAKAIQSVIGGKAVVVVNGFSHQWQLARNCYCSFGITNWVFLGRRLLPVAPILFLFACVRAGW